MDPDKDPRVHLHRNQCGMSNQGMNETRNGQPASSGLFVTRSVHELAATGPTFLGFAQEPG